MKINVQKIKNAVIELDVVDSSDDDFPIFVNGNLIYKLKVEGIDDDLLRDSLNSTYINITTIFRYFRINLYNHTYSKIHIEEKGKLNRKKILFSNIV